MNELPKMPERPTRPEKPEPQVQAKNPLWIRILIWTGFSVVALFVLPWILFGIHPILGAIYLFIFFFVPIALFHYFIWGRWIGDTIRKEVAEEEAREAFDEQERKKFRNHEN